MTARKPPRGYPRVRCALPVCRAQVLTYPPCPWKAVQLLSARLATCGCFAQEITSPTQEELYLVSHPLPLTLGRLGIVHGTFCRGRWEAERMLPMARPATHPFLKNQVTSFSFCKMDMAVPASEEAKPNRGSRGGRRAGFLCSFDGMLSALSQ